MKPFDRHPGRIQFSSSQAFAWGEIYEDARKHGLGRAGFDPISKDASSRTDDSYALEDLSHQPGGRHRKILVEAPNLPAPQDVKDARQAMPGYNENAYQSVPQSQYGSAEPPHQVSPDALQQPTQFAPKYPVPLGEVAIGTVRIQHQ